MTVEELQAQVLKLTEDNKRITAELDAGKTALEKAKTDAETKDKRINQLLDYNQQLFLKVTSDSPKKPDDKPDDKPDETDDITPEELAVKIFKGEVK